MIIMPAATRVGDSTLGNCEDSESVVSGTNTSGSSNVYINGRSAHRVDDTGNYDCPRSGIFRSTEGSSTVFINGKAATRIGDNTVCTNCVRSGYHSSGSPNVYIG